MSRKRIAVWSAVTVVTAGVAAFGLWRPGAGEMRALEREEAALCERIDGIEAGMEKADRGQPDSPAGAEYAKLNAVRKRMGELAAAGVR